MEILILGAHSTVGLLSLFLSEMWAWPAYFHPHRDRQNREEVQRQ